MSTISGVNPTSTATVAPSSPGPVTTWVNPAPASPSATIFALAADGDTAPSCWAWRMMSAPSEPFRPAVPPIPANGLTTNPTMGRRFGSVTVGAQRLETLTIKHYSQTGRVGRMGHASGDRPALIDDVVGEQHRSYEFAGKVECGMR